jgi:hypothetical protein
MDTYIAAHNSEDCFTIRAAVRFCWAWKCSPLWHRPAKSH